VPVVRLNHAIAVAMADGPPAVLALLEGVTGLDRYHLLPAARADLLSRLGRHDEAAESYRLALTLTENPVEQRFLRSRLGRACLAAGVARPSADRHAGRRWP
jgi:predicted RNA polymerase sigma factor